MPEQLPLFSEPVEDRVNRTATLSPCGLYRYTLARQWGERIGNTINFLMLNPSTADADRDDPTIRRCIGFAWSWGYDALVVTNLFALRSTDPTGLRSAANPVGTENDRHILDRAADARLVVCAWGNHGAFGDRAARVLAMLRAAGVEPHALGITGMRQPAHPLYLSAGCRPFPLSPEVARGS